MSLQVAPKASRPKFVIDAMAVKKREVERCARAVEAKASSR
jgi:hypothetical protein